MPVAFDPPKARLDVQERRGHPALLLVAVLPPVDLVGALPTKGRLRLPVRGLDGRVAALKAGHPSASGERLIIEE